ncbi:NAD(P)-dependent oxidoreductase [soil metagenome]
MSENVKSALTKSVSFLGMGIMGAAMAANLVPRLKQNGLRLKVWNRTPGTAGLELAKAAGAEVFDHLKDCVSGSEIVFSCLGDELDVASVLTGPGGVSQLAAKDCLVVDFSTIGPKAARSIAKALALVDMKFLDAPVTGGDIGAKQGTLTIMVGGDLAAFHELEPYLEAMGKTIRHCGKSGNGQALKLTNQTLCALNLIGVCEAISMAEELGLDNKLVVDVLENGAGGSWSLSNLGRRILADDLAPGFATNHMLKDLRLAFENLDSTDCFPGTRLAFDLFEEAMAPLAKTASQELGTQAMIKAYQEKLAYQRRERAPGMAGDRITLEWQLDGE